MVSLRDLIENAQGSFIKVQLPHGFCWESLIYAFNSDDFIYGPHIYFVLDGTVYTGVHSSIKDYTPNPGPYTSVDLYIWWN